MTVLIILILLFIYIIKENLEDEITKRRLMEDEIYQLKHEVRDLKSPVDSEQ